MTLKPAVPRERARRDIREAVRYYRLQAGEDVAIRFVAAYQSALEALAAHPGAGSPRYGVSLDIAGLRSWPLERFPYLIFYIDQRDHIEIWRVLHGSREVTSLLKGDA